jgi:hypothetical protein
MPLREYVLDSLVNKSSELQGHLINPLSFSLRGFVNDVVRALADTDYSSYAASWAVL